jgi:hypothetical protein
MRPKIRKIYSGNPLSAIFSSFGILNQLSLLARICYRGERGEFFLPVSVVTDLLVPVMMWLNLLYDAGIDLIDYGRKEQRVRQEGRTSSQCWFYIWQRAIIRTWGSAPRGYHLADIEKTFLIRFKYGPKPSDWQFWLIEQMDNSLAEFWDMVDHSERAMPGAWDESFDDEYW